MRGLTAYYLATPLFALLDLGAGVSVRAAAIEGTAPRVAYYAVLVVLGVLCRIRPSVAPWIGMGESSLNLLLLILAVLLPIWGASDAVLAGGALTGPEMIMERTMNLAIGGTVLVVSFHRSERRALGRGAGGGA